ncbi:glucose-6-phosphate 1-dehydrogenase [Verrucomicrobiota bacterium]|nr:glucose-6-phosphate 1-dehydrogenase [Verrucomicrobiota bacterium]
MSESDRHPFLSGLSKHRGAQPTCVVIFGASGDLAARKLLPALYNLAVDSLLPADFHLIGFGRKPIPDAEFRTQAAADIQKFSRREFRPDIWKRVEDNMSYQAGGYDEPAAFEALKAQIAAAEKRAGRPLQLVFYVSTPPSVFEPILENLGQSGLAARGLGTDLESKVIIEKPFGKDLDSAVHLNAVAARNFRESQIFRIDHYLGKETVQDLLVLRFANPIFEPLWNRRHVDHVQITVAEELGVGTRGGYYDSSGATRDMLQNHTMQLLALVAMEQPRSLSAEHIRDEKVKLLESIQPLRLGANADAVRAQYAEGLSGGEKSPTTGPRRISRRNPPPKPFARCVSRSRTPAGRASRSTCVRASASRAASPRLPSNLSNRSPASSRAMPATTSRPTAWSSRFSPTKARRSSLIRRCLASSPARSRFA